MKRLAWCICLLLCLGPSMLHAHGPSSDNFERISVKVHGKANLSSMRKAVEELNQRQMEAFRRGDLLAVARVYAENATIYFPSYRRSTGTKISRREAIDQYWLNIKTQHPGNWKSSKLAARRTRFGK